MHEKRLNKRHGREVSVRFGESSTDHIGLARNLSHNGMFIKSSRLYPSQTQIVIKIDGSHGNTIQCEGVVRWAKRVPQALAHLVQQNGMGIALTYSPEEYIEFIR